MYTHMSSGEKTFAPPVDSMHGAFNDSHPFRAPGLVLVASLPRPPD